MIFQFLNDVQVGFLGCCRAGRLQPPCHACNGYAFKQKHRSMGVPQTMYRNNRDVIQASCYPMTSKTNCTTIVFKKFCITTRTRQGKSKPFLEREGVRFFVFDGVPHRTTKASAAHGRAASAQAQCAADAYFLCRAPSPDGKVRASVAF